jgi:signal transduction histidine kinase
MAAGSAEEALERAPGFDPDVVVADLALPGLTGDELGRRLHATPGLAGVPFVLLTTVADATARAAAGEASADDYLHKPLRERELRARVGALVRMRRASLALEARSREQAAVNAALLEAQEALLRAGKMASVGRLAAGLAHEINNPLSYIQAGASALSRALDEVARLASPPGGAPGKELQAALDEAREVIAEMKAGSRQLGRITGDLRFVGASDAPSEELVELPEVLESALVLARSRFAALPRVELDVEPGPPIESVAHMLVQGLYPIVENAVLAAGEEGLVRLGVRQLNVGVELFVSDDGPGIPEATLPRIFDPFFSTRSPGQGTGLGLSVAYGIVHGLGGDIRVESGPGRGTTFRVRLPRRHAAQMGLPAGEEPVRH